MRLLMDRARSVALLILLLAGSFACSPSMATEPKRLLLLHSFGREFRPWSEYAQSIRQELDRESPWPLEVVEYSLVTARFGDENPELPFVGYLHSLFTEHPLDLIVSIGAPAADFVQRYRSLLFPKTPMLFTAVEQRRVRFATLTQNDAVVSVAHDLPAVVENILKVLPETKTIYVVNGNSPLETYWRAEMQREFKPFEDRVRFVWYNKLSFADILKNAALLPPDSAIFWELMIVDAAGVVHEADNALTKLHAVANAPIFSFDDSFFGRELVGGPMHSVLESSKQTAAVAVRILSGERPADIKTPPIGFAAPKYDWREMKRWGISESRLPPGSTIFFREPSAWEQYSAQILLICAALLLQGALITWLSYEHRRRRLAEVQSRNSMSELMQMNRLSTAGELSASIAHEVNQPLTGMMASATAALRWLSRENPNLGKAQEALRNAVAAGDRASDIITSIRAMFRRDTQTRTKIDLNKLIRTVLGLVYIDLRKHSIEAKMDLSEQLPPVIGNEVQLQQVILNLVMNAIDAMGGAEPRLLSIKTKTTENNAVQVSIADTGNGIGAADLNRVFEPLFTTKARGMGMGLSICRSIIESHKGQIWVSIGLPRGSVFHFKLPMYQGSKAKSDLSASAAVSTASPANEMID
jgi:signal transduction histidine kinase